MSFVNDGNYQGCIDGMMKIKYYEYLRYEKQPLEEDIHHSAGTVNIISNSVRRRDGSEVGAVADASREGRVRV